MQPITIITAGIFFVVLYLRFQNRSKDGARRGKSQKGKLVKVLLAAIVAWMAVSYSLRHSMAKIEGTDQEPSSLERVVSFLSSHL